MTAQPLWPTVPKLPLTVVEYAALPEDEVRHELQEGIPIMSPRPRPRHQRCLRLLAAQLSEQLPDHEVMQEIDVDLQLAEADKPGTVRVPDLAVVTRSSYRDVDADERMFIAAEVVLAIEVISRGSVRMDTRVKRSEYADAGIQHYWMVDLTDGPSLVACHLGGEFGYLDSGPMRGEFVTEVPFSLRIDLAALVDD